MKGMITRVLSVVLALAILCSFMVLPASATDPYVGFRLGFTAENGNELGSTISAGDTIVARLLTEKEIEFTNFQMTVSVNADKLTVVDQKKPSAKNSKYVTSEVENEDEAILSLTQNCAAGTDGQNVSILKASYASSVAITWRLDKALISFKLTANSDIGVTDLADLVQFEAKNVATNQTIHGVADCMTVVKNKDTSTSYTSNYNVCPYVAAIGHTLGNNAYDTQVTVDQLRQNLSFGAYEASGAPAGYNKDNVRIYTDSSKETELDDTAKLSECLNGTSGEYATGNLYIEVTTTTGLTLGKTTEIRLKKDEVTGFELKPASGGFTFTYNDNAKSFELDDDSFTIQATYKSGANGPMTGSVSHGKVNAGTGELEVTLGGTNFKTTIDYNIEKHRVTVPQITGGALSYNGAQQKVNIWKDDLYTISDDTATDVGPYAATVTLKDPTNVRWDDEQGDAATRTVNWTINQATGYLKVEQKGDIYTSTRIEDITDLSKNYLQTVANPNNPGTLTKPNGTITLTSDGSSFYPNGFTFGEGTHTVHYKFTADNANYADVTGTLTLKVKGRTVTSIVVGGTLKKTEYTYGQEFDPDGLTVTAYYSDSTNKDVTSEVEWIKDLGNVGTKTATEVTGNFGGKTINLPTGMTITVIPVLISTSNAKIKLKDPNARIEYNGDAHEPEFYVECELSNDPHFTIPADQYTEAVYENNTNAGTAKIRVTGKDNANYKIGGTVEGTFTIWKKPVTMKDIVLEPKTFDGGRSATITSCTLDGVLEKDKSEVSLDSHLGTATYADEVPGTHKVTFAYYALTGSKKDNYSLSQPTAIKGTIDKKEIEVSALTVKNKAYDGTKTAEIDFSKVTFTGEVTSQSSPGTKYPARLDTSASTAEFADAGVGKHNVTLDLKLDSTSQNYYTLKPYRGTVQGEITQRIVSKSDYNFGTVTVIKGKGEFTKPTFTTAINGSNVSITTGDLTYKVKVNGVEQTYDHTQLVDYLKTLDKDATVNATVSATATDNFTGSVSGTITFNVVDIIFKLDGTQIGASDPAVFQFKDGENANVYNAGTAGDYLKINGTITASVNGKDINGRYYFVFDNKGENDKVAPAGQNHTFKLLFDSTTVGYDYTGVQVGAAWEDRYIRPATVTVGSGVEVASKVYDGTTAATVSTENAVINGKLGNDVLTLTASNATFDTKNVGTGKTVRATLTLGGTDAGNYIWAADTLTNSISYRTTGEITPKDVTITGVTVDASRAYDGKRSATIDATHAVISGKIGNDDVDIKYGTATYADKNVGTGKTVTFSDFSLKGADKDNYNLTKQPDSVQANITAKELHITNFTVKDKVYDGNNIAEIVSIETDALANDDVKCSNAIARFVASGTFSASDAQNGKKVTLEFPQGVILTGADKDNYTFDKVELANEVTANIAKANLTGAPTFTKITQSGKTLEDVSRDGVFTSGLVTGVDGKTPTPLTFDWVDDGKTVIQPNKSYSWTIDAGKNYNVLTGSVVLYPVSTGYSDQVKKQIEEFEAKKRGELPEEDTTFRDVSEDDYFFDAVNWAAENGITGGVSANRFGPTQDCSRGQTMTFLWRAMGEPEPASRASDLNDVMTGSYYYDAVLWAMEAGITTGAGANRFAPDATVTRGQFVTFLYRLANASSSGEHPFTDVPAGSYYEKAIAWAYAEGITKGTGATTFSPDAPCTRAQIITFLYRYFNR